MAEVISVSSLKKGVHLMFKGQVHIVVDADHVFQGRGGGYIQTKMRNLETGSNAEHRFAATERVEKALLDKRKMEYLYDDGSNLVFMDQENYEQIEFAGDFLGEKKGYLIPNLEVEVVYCQGQALDINLPPNVILEVEETEPGLKGATVTNVYKPATMETGITVSVPPFISIGERIKVDTRDGKYVERVRS